MFAPVGIVTVPVNVGLAVLAFKLIRLDNEAVSTFSKYPPNIDAVSVYLTLASILVDNEAVSVLFSLVFIEVRKLAFPVSNLY